MLIQLITSCGRCGLVWNADFMALHGASWEPQALVRNPRRQAKEFLNMANRWHKTLNVPTLLVPYKGKVWIAKLSHGREPSFGLLPANRHFHLSNLSKSSCVWVGFLACPRYLDRIEFELRWFQQKVEEWGSWKQHGGDVFFFLNQTYMEN